MVHRSPVDDVLHRHLDRPVDLDPLAAAQQGRVIVLALQQHDGLLKSLGIGTWKAHGPKVLFRCPDCGGVYDVPRSDVDARGFASFGLNGRFFFCQTPACNFVRGIQFEGWPPALPFDVSDAKARPS
jgi:hypothetical protein